VTEAPLGTAVAPARGGPAWLAERRASAAAAFSEARLPTEADEDWRYGRVDELDLAAFSPARLTDGALADGPAARALLGALGERACLVRTGPGRVEVDLAPPAAATGLAVSPLSALERAPFGYGSLVGAAPDAFTFLAEAEATDAVVVEVPAGVRVDEPIVVVHDLASAEDGAAYFPRTFVSLGEDARASVVELVASNDARLLALPVTELELGPGASLAYHAVQQLGRRAWQLGYQASTLGPGAELTSFTAAFGGDYARLSTRSSLTGEHARSRLLAVYFGDGGQVQDLRTFQEHVAPRTRSELVFKGAVADTARSVYSGLIRIAKGAYRSDAGQTNRNLVLSEGARADSVPNLEIEENDVRCSHASAVGPIDAEQRFYLETRGVPPEVADRLILLGFFGDLLEEAPLAGLAALLREVVASRLASRLAPPGSRP
jgi:Fe-S cluster assembly protein SufD